MSNPIWWPLPECILTALPHLYASFSVFLHGDSLWPCLSPKCLFHTSSSACSLQWESAEGNHLSPNWKPTNRCNIQLRPHLRIICLKPGFVLRCSTWVQQLIGTLCNVNPIPPLCAGARQECPSVRAHGVSACDVGISCAAGRASERERAARRHLYG